MPFDNFIKSWHLLKTSLSVNELSSSVLIKSELEAGMEGQLAVSLHQMGGVKAVRGWLWKEIG